MFRERYDFEADQNEGGPDDPGPNKGYEEKTVRKMDI